MISKNFFILMFLIAGGASLYLAGDFFYRLNEYFTLTHSAPAVVSDWKVVEKREGKFSIEALFSYHIGDQEITGRYLFPKPVYSNPYVAEDLVEHWREKEWTIWYSPKRPHDALLQKAFPLKKGVYLVLSLCIILYFAFLYQYAKRMHAPVEGNGKAPEPPS